MTRNLLITTAALFLLGSASAMAQSSVPSQENQNDPNCAGTSSAGCPTDPDDINTQSGPSDSGNDNQNDTDGSAGDPSNSSPGSGSGSDSGSGTSSGGASGSGSSSTGLGN